MVFIAAGSMLLAEDVVEIDPFSFFSQAIKDTRLLTVNVSVWFKEQNVPNEMIWEMEESLENMIQQKFADRGFVADVFHDISLQPHYKKDSAFYEDQLDLAANLVIDVLKKEDAVFIKLNCYKDYPESNALIFERTFQINPNDSFGEQNELPGWWMIACKNILPRVERFLDELVRINPGPYGWLRLKGESSI